MFSDMFSARECSNTAGEHNNIFKGWFSFNNNDQEMHHLQCRSGLQDQRYF